MEPSTGMGRGPVPVGEGEHLGCQILEDKVGAVVDRPAH